MLVIWVIKTFFFIVLLCKDWDHKICSWKYPTLQRPVPPDSLEPECLTPPWTPSGGVDGQQLQKHRVNLHRGRWQTSCCSVVGNALGMCQFVVGGHSSQLWGTILKSKGAERIYRSFGKTNKQTNTINKNSDGPPSPPSKTKQNKNPGRGNIKRLLLINENQISRVNEFSALLFMGRYKHLVLLELSFDLHLDYQGPISCFSASWIPQGEPSGGVCVCLCVCVCLSVCSGSWFNGHNILCLLKWQGMFLVYRLL